MYELLVVLRHDRIDLRRKYFIDPWTVSISAIINQIIKDWPDIPRIIGSVDQVKTFAGGLIDANSVRMK
jgi:hypothetical protein